MNDCDIDIALVYKHKNFFAYYDIFVLSAQITCVQLCVQINNRSRKPPIYQYFSVRGFVRIPSRA